MEITSYRKTFPNMKSLFNQSKRFLIQFYIFNCRGAYNFDELLRFSSENDLRKVSELQASISPDSGAMIQFTSGTTGKPKATLLSHFGMVNNSYFIGKESYY